MNGMRIFGIAALTTLVAAACGGPDAAPAPAADGAPAAEEPAEVLARTDAAWDSPGERTSPGMPPARSGQGMPMGGEVAEMQGRMMGGGAPEDAPEAAAAAASTPGCPDVSQELVDRGRGVWTGSGNCFACHGGDATGSQLGPDLTDGEWLNVEGTYGSIAKVVRTGVSEPQQFPAPMPPMGGGSLSQDQVCAVAAYVYSLSR